MRIRLVIVLAAGALVTSCGMAGASSPATSAAPVTVGHTIASVIAPVITTSTTAVPTDPVAERATVGHIGEGCTATGRSAVIDRAVQRAWLCEDGLVTARFPITTAIDQPDPGHYKVYAKDLTTYSTAGGHWSTMTHFVAFARGKNTGARVAFHSVPTLRNGQYAQPLASVGDLDRRGSSSGCIRVLYATSVLIWDTLQIGDAVVVIS